MCDRGGNSAIYIYIYICAIEEILEQNLSLLYMYIYTHTHIQRERERERERGTSGVTKKKFPVQHAGQISTAVRGRVLIACVQPQSVNRDLLVSKETYAKSVKRDLLVSKETY